MFVFVYNSLNLQLEIINNKINYNHEKIDLLFFCSVIFYFS